MTSEETADITIRVLKDIRAEIRGFRLDTNQRFEQVDRRFEQVDRRFERMDKRFERMDNRFDQMDQRFGRMEEDIRAIVGHFDRDYMTLAGKVGELEGRLESHLSQSR